LGEISYWELSSSQQALILKGLRMPEDVAPELLLNRLDALRLKYNVEEDNYIDNYLIRAIIEEDLERQAVETWKLRIPLYLENLKSRIQSNSYIDFINLSIEERKAIQYALNVRQNGDLDEYTMNRLDAIKLSYNIPDIGGHLYAINGAAIDAIISEYELRAAWESDNETLAAIIEFLVNNNIGELFYSAVVLWASSIIPIGAAYDAKVLQDISKIESGLSDISFTGKIEKTAEDLNAFWKSKGYTNPPYKADIPAYQIKLTNNYNFVRVYDGVHTQEAGQFIMKLEDITNADGSLMTAQQIKDKYALEFLPKYVADADIPANTIINCGIAGRIDGWGSGGGLQFDLNSAYTGNFTFRCNLPN